jgi:hypothetical protein
VIVWGPCPTENACCTCGAGPYVAFPAWFASIVQVPTPVKVTFEPAIEQTLLAVGSIVSATGRPELAVAVAVYVPPNAAAVGAVDVNVIVWSATSALADESPIPPTMTTIAATDIPMQSLRTWPHCAFKLLKIFIPFSSPLLRQG